MRQSPPTSDPYDDAFCGGGESQRGEQKKRGSPVRERRSWRELLWLGEATTGRTMRLSAAENRASSSAADPRPWRA
jgi:hypothetical protein